jgi:hypothetical protein
MLCGYSISQVFFNMAVSILALCKLLSHGCLHSFQRMQISEHFSYLVFFASQTCMHKYSIKYSADISTACQY